MPSLQHPLTTPRQTSRFREWSTTKTKGYFSVERRGIDAAMDKALKGYKLPIESIRRNLRITKKRSRGERPYSVMKRTFHGDHTYVTTVPRVRVKAMIAMGDLTCIE